MKRPEAILDQEPKGKDRKRPRIELHFDGRYYDVTTWAKHHPGGKIIEFYTEKGEDASIAIQQFHQRSMPKVMSVLNSLKCRPVSNTALTSVSCRLRSPLPNLKSCAIDLTAVKRPPLSALSRHKTLSEDFIRLHSQLEKGGYFRPSVLHVCYRLLELAVLAVMGLYGIRGGNSFGWKVIGIVFLSLLQGRSASLLHECRHYSLTGKTKVDRRLLRGLGGKFISNKLSKLVLKMT